PRRVRGPYEFSLELQIDAFQFSQPVIGASMDSVMSPATAIQLGQLGGMGVLNLEGLLTRYEDPQPVLDEIAALKSQTSSPENTARRQERYAAPYQPDL